MPIEKRFNIESKLAQLAVYFSEDSIIITDTEINEPGPSIVYVNPAFEKMTGYQADEVMGRNPRFLQGPNTPRSVLDHIRLKLSKGEVFRGQAINYRKDGTEFWNEWHIEPIRDKEGEITHFLAIQRDITERKKAEQELEQKNMALKEILEQIELEKKKIKDDIMMNVEEVMIPTLKKLHRKGGRIDKKYIEVMEANLNDMTSSFGMEVSERKYKLSPREIEISTMIKNGLSNKEMADLLNVSVKTIETHRNKIRKKLGIINKDINLTSYLQSI